MTDPHAFSSLMHSLSPEEVRQTADEVEALIGIGETERQNVTDHRDAKLEIRDAAKTDRDAEQDSLTETLGKLGDSNDEVTRLKTELVAAKELVTEATNAKAAADEREADELVAKNTEIARVDDEKATLERVKALLEGLLPQAEESEEPAEEEPAEEEPAEEEPAEEEPVGEALIGLTSNPRRNLLSMSRTTRILSDPSFIKTLQNADPEAVQRVIDLIVKMLDAAEDDRQAAIDKWQDAVDAALLAVQDLEAAKAHQSRTEGLLSTEEGTVSALETERDNQQDVVDEKQSILDAAQAKLDTWQQILDDETARIDHEKGILEDALAKLLTLEKVIQTLE